MGIESIRWGLPFCESVTEQTECSLITRTALVGLGGITLLVGIFALSGIPGLNALSTSEGIILTSMGGLTLLIGLCIRCVKQNTEKRAELNTIAPENQVARYENTKRIQFQAKHIESIWPHEILVIIFQTLNIEKIPVVARVCIAWYRAIKQNALWMFYLKRDYEQSLHEASFILRKAHSEIVSGEPISYELQYRKQKLHQVFDRLLTFYYGEVDQLDFYRSGTRALEAGWQLLSAFTERYPEFKSKLPKKIEPSTNHEPERSLLWELQRAIGYFIYDNDYFFKLYFNRQF